MFRPQSATLHCPHCGFSYRAPIFSIIDVGQTPELKQALLAGQLNASQCQNCGNVNYLTTPLLYHDPEHEFLGVFMPAQLNIKEPQRQKTIGDLTKALMDALPAEQRRGYMLNPQQFLTMDSLIEKILGFDGVTPEMIAASRKKLDLLDRLATQKDDALVFTAAVAENKDLLDEEFFMLIGNFIVSAESQGQTTAVEALKDLREKLIPLTDVGRKIQKQRAAVARLGASPTREDVMQAVLACDMDEIDAIAIAVAPALDYQFFQDLTAHIEAAAGDVRALLEQKRARMLQILESLRQSEQQQIEAASAVIRELLSAEDMEAAVQQYLPYLDRTVMAILQVNIANAEKQGATAAAGRMKDLLEMIVAQMEESVPPEMMLFLRLADAQYPDETRALLRENKESINADFFGLMEASIEEIEAASQEDQERRRMVRHLRNVLTQARLGV